MLALLLLALAQDPWRPVPSEDNWVTGVVELPAGTPESELCQVLVEAQEPEWPGDDDLSSLWKLMGEDPWYEVDSTIVDPSGAFRLRLPVEAREVRLRVDGDHLMESAEPLAAWWRGVDPVRLRPKAGCRLRVEFVAASQGAVFDPSEAVLLATHIDWNRASGTIDQFVARLDPDHSATLSGIPRGAELRLELRGCSGGALAGIRRVALTQARDQHLTLPFVARRHLRLRVMNRAGTIIEDLTVRTEADLPACRNGDERSFDVPQGWLGSATLTALGYRSRVLHAYDWEPGLAPPSIDVVLDELPALRGRLLLAEGTPAAGTPLRVATSCPDSHGFSVDVVTAEDGSFAVHPTLDQPLLLFAAPDEQGVCLPPRAVHWDAQDEHVLELAPVLRGRVFDGQGRPFAEASVMAIGYEPTQHVVPYAASGNLKGTLSLDANGRFTWAGLWPGRWRVFLWAPGTEHQELMIDVGGDDLEHTWILERQATLAGTVRGLDGDPVAGVAILWNPGRGNSTSASTDDEGRFLIEGAATGAGELSLGGDAYRSIDPWSGSVASGEVVGELELTAAPCAAMLVRILDAGGRPASGVKVEVETDHYRGSAAWTDVQGRVWIAGIRPGEVRLTLFEVPRPGRLQQPLIRTQTVQLPPGETIEFEYRVK